MCLGIPGTGHPSTSTCAMCTGIEAVDLFGPVAHALHATPQPPLHCGETTTHNQDPPITDHRTLLTAQAHDGPLAGTTDSPRDSHAHRTPLQHLVTSTQSSPQLLDHTTRKSTAHMSQASAGFPVWLLTRGSIRYETTW